MKEYRLILASQQQDGKYVELRIFTRFEAWMVDLWEGFTLYCASGAFKHPDGRVQYEPVYIYDLALPEADYGKLEDMARTFCKEANQVCVYIRHADGTVRFVA